MGARQSGATFFCDAANHGGGDAAFLCTMTKHALMTLRLPRTFEHILTMQLAPNLNLALSEPVFLGLPWRMTLGAHY